MGGVSKAVGGFVTKVTGSDSLGKLAGAIFNPIELPFVTTGVILDKVSDSLGALGLDSLSKEIGRWSDHNMQVGAVLRGQYHDDMKKIGEFQAIVDESGRVLNSKIAAYNNSLDDMIAKMERLIAFEEIFHMAMKNRMGSFQALNGPELTILTEQHEILVRELKRMVAQLKAEYDFVIGLTEGPFIQRLIGSIIMIVGGLQSDLHDIVSGKADGETFQRVITAVIIIVIVIYSWGTALGAVGAAAPFFMASAVLASIAAFMNLDGMYANGAATGAIMSALDFLFNDLLNLDSLIGSDFEKFDKEHEDYQEMVGYTKLAIGLAALITAWGGSWAGSGDGGAGTGASSTKSMFDKFQNPNIGTADAYGTSVGSSQTEMLAMQDSGFTVNTSDFLGGTIKIGDTLQSSSVFGLKLSTYQDIFSAFSTAMKAKDTIGANDQFEQLRNKLISDYDKLNQAIVKKTNKKMMLSYKDTAYFLQDQQDHIDRYVWSMTSQNLYVDPYGTTPVANIRFKPDKDTRATSFGFEDMFDESTQAGSKAYFNNIIYG